jgi:hypothetical protein
MVRSPIVRPGFSDRRSRPYGIRSVISAISTKVFVLSREPPPAKAASHMVKKRVRGCGEIKVTAISMSFNEGSRIASGTLAQARSGVSQMRVQVLILSDTPLELKD